MATPFKIVVPVGLRKHPDYYTDEKTRTPHTFVYVGDDTEVGVFSSRDHKMDTVKLFKSDQPHGHHFKEFSVEDPRLLRRDEFEAMHQLILELDEYHFLIDNASHGVMDQSLVYLHLCLMAKVLDETPEETFARFCVIDYDVEKLRSAPWK